MKQNNRREDDQLKEIPKWTRKYAQNRTIPFLVSTVISMILFAAIAIPSWLGGNAYRAGDMVLFWICNSVTAIAMISLFFFCVPKWGGKFIERISQRLYGREGTASIPEPESMKKKKWIGHVVGIIFVGCVLGSVFLGFKGYIPIKYMQPVSAIYLVPFTVFLYAWQKPKVGPLILLWPILYSIHAILIIAGAPILFTGNLEFMNMLLPVFGYGVLTQIIGHLYSRYALKKLKATAHLAENTNG